MPSPETPPPPASERACFGITSFFPGQVNVEPRPPDSKQDAAGEVGADSFPASPRGGQRIPCAAVFLKFPALPEASCGNPEPSLPLPSPGHHVRPPRPPHTSPPASRQRWPLSGRGENLIPPFPGTCVSWGPRLRRVKRSAYLEVSGKPLPASPPQLGFLAPCHLGPPPCIDILFVFLSALHSKNNCLSSSLFPRLFMMWTMTRRSLLFRSPGGL